MKKTILAALAIFLAGCSTNHQNLLEDNRQLILKLRSKAQGTDLDAALMSIKEVEIINSKIVISLELKNNLNYGDCPNVESILKPILNCDFEVVADYKTEILAEVNY